MVATSACCAVGLALSQRFGWPITLIWFVIKASLLCCAVVCVPGMGLLCSASLLGLYVWLGVVMLMKHRTGWLTALFASFLLSKWHTGLCPTNTLTFACPPAPLPSLQFLTIGRLIGNAYRLWSRNGPLAGELHTAAA